MIGTLERHKIIIFVTRGMKDELPMVKEMVKKVVKAGSKVYRWVLVSIKDPGVDVVSITNDHEDLDADLNELTYGGGGDIQEQVLKGGENCYFTRCHKLPKVALSFHKLP